MIQVFEMTGLHCGGCAARAEKTVAALAPGATVTLDPPRLALPPGATTSLEAINAALAEVGGYRAKPLPASA